VKAVMGAKESAYYKGLGEWILLKRRALGMTQIDMAQTFDVHSSAVQRWEAGRSRVSAYVVNEIKRMLQAKGMPR
jgi:transcriptional regulator with XRE-family HTH domain